MSDLFKLLSGAQQLQPQQQPAGLAPLPTGNLGAGSSLPIDPKQGAMVADLLTELQMKKAQHGRDGNLHQALAQQPSPSPAPNPQLQQFGQAFKKALPEGFR